MFDPHWGLATTRTLLSAGVTRSAIAANVRAGRWQRVFRGVYANYTGPVPRQTLLVAALYYAGHPALLSHRTAATEWGLLAGSDAEPIHVTVPYECSSASSSSLVRVHRSRAFRHIMVAYGDLPRTSRADTVIDVAASAASPETAVQEFLAIAGKSGVMPGAFTDRLDKRPVRRYDAALREAVRLLSSGIQSALEHRYATDVERRHGIPESHRQTPFVVNGKTLFEDATYDHIGVALTVRLDGREYHLRPRHHVPGPGARQRRRTRR